MKEKIINYLKSQGFEAISHDSSKKQIFCYDNITVAVEEQRKNK
jgi:hypothetical protein